MARGAGGGMDDNATASAARPVEILGEVWAGWGREEEAMRRLLGADIKAMRTGPDLPGMVIRTPRKHYVFVDQELASAAPIVHRVVLAHEAAHIMRGVRRAAFCCPVPELAVSDPVEWKVWQDTGKLFVPRRYARLMLAGESPEQILARHGDEYVLPHMIEWRALIEVAEGRAAGDPAEAQARADEIARTALRALRAATCAVHACPTELDARDAATRMAFHFVGGWHAA